MKISAEHSQVAFSPVEIPKTSESTEKPGPSFGETLSAALQDMDATTKQADQTSNNLITGDVDIHEAMVSMEKADLVLKLGVSVRNKVLEAYRTLSQMS